MSGQLKEVRDRMKSVSSTQQITSAMKMVSAAKLRRAQESIIRLRPFTKKFYSILSHILDNLEGNVNTPFVNQRVISKVLVVVVTSNRGLCGAFNNNIIKLAVKRIDEEYAHVRAAGGLTIMCIGKRGYDYFKKRYTDCTLIEDNVNLFKNLVYSDVEIVANEILDAFEVHDYDAVDVAYGRFKNPALQFPELEAFLPIQIKKEKLKTSRADYIFEPAEEELLHELVPSILRSEFYKFMLDTHASEHGARMTAMEMATENAQELLKDLRISYNKARQEAITRELSEIVGGAAALEG
jgi:F-type H+-transporting ATPase subunit gamma